MKREILKQFEELEDLVDIEIKNIASKLLEEYSTYQEAVDALNDYYRSRFKLDDHVYSEIHKKMIAQSTKGQQQRLPKIDIDNIKVKNIVASLKD